MRGTIAATDNEPVAAHPNRLLTDKQTERHSYEKCQYEEFKLRVKKMEELKAEKGGARSN